MQPPTQAPRAPEGLGRRLSERATVHGEAAGVAVKYCGVSQDGQEMTLHCD